jgi:methyl-accepting chemotaxis protein
MFPAMALKSMASVFSRRRADEIDDEGVGGAGEGSAGRASQFIAEVGEQAGRLNNEIVDVSGHLDGLAETVRSQALAFGELAASAKIMREMLDGITQRADNTNERLGQTRSRVHNSRSTAEEGITEVSRLVKAVQVMGQELNGFRQALAGVGAVAAKVGRIAQQTNLLALNATIEASRAGALGAGFAVVAREVKELSRVASQDTRQIAEAVEHLSTQAERLLTHGASTVEQASTVQTGVAALGEVLNIVDSAMEGACQEARSIAEGAATAGGRVTEVQSSLSTLTDQVGLSARALEDARSRVAGLIRVGESLVEITIASGAKTQDTPFVKVVVEAAAKISQLFEAAVARGEITLDALMSDQLSPIAGSNPQQMMAAFTNFTDRVLPAIQEPILNHDQRIVFCAAVDRQGYLPTHNRKYSQTPGPDPTWNAANCRNRRVFNDRVGLAAGRNDRPYLVQTYRRDMGGGTFAMMKDVSAPIRVRGRHWGGLRLAYRV